MRSNNLVLRFLKIFNIAVNYIRREIRTVSTEFCLPFVAHPGAQRYYY